MNIQVGDVFEERDGSVLVLRRVARRGTSFTPIAFLDQYFYTFRFPKGVLAATNIAYLMTTLEEQVDVGAFIHQDCL